MLNTSIRRSSLALMLAAGAAFGQNTPKPTPAPAPAPTSPTAPAAPAAPATPAQPESKTDEKLPAGKEILAKYIEVTGGRPAYEKIKTRVSEGTVEIAPLGIKGKMVLKQEAPAKMVLNIDMDSIGSISQGNNGKHAWQSSAMTGASLLTGKELEESNAQAQLAAELNPDLIYKSVETKRSEKVGEVDCYVVELETKGGSKRTAYYGKTDGLLHRMDISMTSDMGTFNAQTLLSDYRDADGVKIPFKTTMVIAMGQEIRQTIAFTKVTHNAELPADTFNPPKDVQALIDKPAGKPEEKPAEKPAEAKPEEKKPAPAAPAPAPAPVAPKK